jgi:hypothetical protein
MIIGFKGYVRGVVVGWLGWGIRYFFRREEGKCGVVVVQGAVGPCIRPAGCSCIVTLDNAGTTGNPIQQRSIHAPSPRALSYLNASTTSMVSYVSSFGFCFVRSFLAFGSSFFRLIIRLASGSFFFIFIFCHLSFFTSLFLFQSYRVFWFLLFLAGVVCILLLLLLLLTGSGRRDWLIYVVHGDGWSTHYQYYSYLINHYPGPP